MKVILSAVLALSNSCSAFVQSPVFTHATGSQKDIFSLNAFTDGDSGINGVVDLSLKSNVSKQNLPPSELPNGGRISMVGSGPGDPDLLTMAAHKILADPDALVVSDRLVSKEILDLIEGEIKIARKLPGCAEDAQEEVSSFIHMIYIHYISLYSFHLSAVFNLYISTIYRFTDGAKKE